MDLRKDVPPGAVGGLGTAGEGSEKSAMEAYPAHGIGWAVKQLQFGLKLRRRGWNARNQWVELQVPDLNSKMTLPYVYIRTVQGHLVPWLCSQTDLLAMDWEVATSPGSE